MFNSSIWPVIWTTEWSIVVTFNNVLELRAREDAGVHDGAVHRQRALAQQRRRHVLALAREDHAGRAVVEVDAARRQESLELCKVVARRHARDERRKVSRLLGAARVNRARLAHRVGREYARHELLLLGAQARRDARDEERAE